MNIGLIPLDERPVNARYPVLLTQDTPHEVIVPPAALLSAGRRPADSAALLAWLEAQAPYLDALIVSIEMLAYGGLIASRTSHEPLEVLQARLGLLRRLKARHPSLKVYAFNVITRISRHDDNVEEPDYWAEYGARLFRFSQQADMAQQGLPAPDLEALRAAIPPHLLADFTQRRLRNHALNLSALGLLYEGVLDVLVLSSDDTSVYGFGSGEKRWLTTWAERLAYSAPQAQLLMYPGADEVGCVLLARLVNEAAGQPLRCTVRYYEPANADTIAAFEDGPIRLTVERQLRAAALAQVEAWDEADVRLLVNPPLDSLADWPRPYTPDEAARRTGLAIPAGVNAVADVAHANGSDLVFLEALRPAWPGLLAYSAWNTAANSIGTTLAAAVLGHHYGKNEAFLAHRLIEDGLYQGQVRQEAREWLMARTGHYDPAPSQIAQTAAWIEARLNEACAAWGLGYRVRAVRLPWGRTFELDFDLERL
jgi:hypothetical protein